MWCQSLHRLHLNQILTILSFTNLQKHSLDQIRICVILGRYAVGVHRRVDIYSIESAGIEYSIDMKVGVLNMGVSTLLFSWRLVFPPYCSPTQVLSIPRPAPRCQSLGQTLGKEQSMATYCLWQSFDSPSGWTWIHLHHQIWTMFVECLYVKHWPCFLLRQNPTVWYFLTMTRSSLEGSRRRRRCVLVIYVCDSNVISFSYQIHSLIEKSLLKSWDAHQTRWA